MRKLFTHDLFNLFFIAFFYMLLITLTLFVFDIFEVKTTGSVFLETLSSITIFKIFNNTLFNGLFTLFLIISFVLVVYKSLDLYIKKDSTFKN
ncbi:MAG: hypothetical protein ACTIDZ_01780 [Staphylococcus sp.]|uniref:hypothetical protein n=1 Tax=Staphylococcus sp. TaxID=29387 RepID=UPI003F9D9A3B